MTGQGTKQDKIKVGLRQAIKILAPYVKNKILEQVRSVALIITYLLFFQTIVLQMPIEQAALIAVGLALVIGGLSLFMEGLILGLMPLGELIGLKLPQKSSVWVILIFAFILGIGVTLAEPAIGVLKTAGESVKPWDAPLLFLMLNRFPHYLVYAVGIGVGIAVLFGMLRYLYNWSLKPFIYVLVLALVIVSGWAYLDPNLSTITGLAWDCGAVTTGPVTMSSPLRMRAKSGLPGRPGSLSLRPLRRRLTPPTGSRSVPTASRQMRSRPRAPLLRTSAENRYPISP